MTGIYFTADPHIGHDKVAEIRGMSTVAHDALFKREWEKRVKPTDTVWVLGDISQGGTAAQERALEFFKELPGTKLLVAGNHDSCSPMHGKTSIAWTKKYLEVFDWVGMAAQINLNGHKVLLSHFPYNRDHAAYARYAQWRLRNEGNFLLHGHTHSTEMVTSKREFCVGWDVEKRPISLGDIAKKIPVRNGERHANGTPPA